MDIDNCWRFCHFFSWYQRDLTLVSVETVSRCAAFCLLLNNCFDPTVQISLMNIKLGLKTLKSFLHGFMYLLLSLFHLWKIFLNWSQIMPILRWTPIEYRLWSGSCGSGIWCCSECTLLRILLHIRTGTLRLTLVASSSMREEGAGWAVVLILCFLFWLHEWLWTMDSECGVSFRRFRFNIWQFLTVSTRRTSLSLVLGRLSQSACRVSFAHISFHT